MADTQEKRRRGWRPKSAHVIAVLLALGATTWVASGVVTGNVPDAASDHAGQAAASEPIPSVRILHSMARERLREVVLFGRTEAINKADIAAETSGRVVTKSVEKGGRVKKGQVIYRLAMDNRKSLLAEAEAKVKYQEIAYNAAMRLSEKQFQSKVKLAEEEAALETARAALSEIKLDISRVTIRAPIGGVVDDLPLSVGDYVTSGDVVAAIVDLDPVRVVAQVSERDVSRLTEGSEATAVLPNGKVMSGSLKYVSRTGSAATRTFRVEVWTENPEDAVPEGLTAELRIPAEREKAHLITPAVLTLDDNGVIGIKAVDGGGIVRFHPIKIVADTEDGIWLGGLPDELDIITVGQEFVKAGQKVSTGGTDGSSDGAGDGAGGNPSEADPS